MAPDEFLQIADEMICQRDGREIHRRCAVSRAYYGVFHLAKDLAISKFGYIPPVDNSSVHSDLSKFLLESGQEKLGIIGRELHAMKKVRGLADYDLKRFLSENNAKLNIVKTRMIAALITQLSGRETAA